MNHGVYISPEGNWKGHFSYVKVDIVINPYHLYMIDKFKMMDITS